MSYLALARKYRPQTFEAMTAQHFVTKTLQNAISMGRVSHAYLFTGPRGVGKTSAARIFAKALNCLSPDGVQPCGKCENCLEITNGTSIDVIEIDGASNRGVEEIRSLREAAKFVPVNCKYKIYIVDEVHMLTKEAFNALLKTLEEPPKFVIFIFATTDQHKLPPTIISRCQRYKFTKIPHDEMFNSVVKILQAENVPFEEDALNLVIRNSEGCMRDALSILDQVIAYTDGNVDMQSVAYLMGISDKYLADEVFAAVLKEDVDKIPNLVSSMDEKGVDYKYAAECLIEHTRNMLFFVATDKMPGKEWTASEKEFYLGLKKYASDKRLYALFQIFQRLINDLKFFEFSRYVFEFALFKAASLSKIIPVPVVPIKTEPLPIKAEPLIKTENVAPEEPAVQIKETPEEPVTTASTPDVVAESEDSSGSAIWEKALEKIKKDQSPFGCNIYFGYLVYAGADKIILGFHKEREFYYNFYNKPDKKAKMQEILNSIVNPAPKFEMVLEDTPESKKKAPADIMMEAESHRIRQAKKAAREDPVVKAVIEQTGADVVSIEILGENLK